MTIGIKFCGLSTEKAVDLAAELGAWKVGFIFFEKSPRHVAIARAAELAKRARGLGLGTVAVTVNAEDGYLDRIVAEMKPDMLQLHGSETAERLAVVKARHGLPVMKAFSIRERADFAVIEPFVGHADLMLYDAKPPAGSVLPGGNGVSFDWRLLEGMAEKADYVLSGGLTTTNVGDALAISGARMLDVSSGIESAPGVKDADKMRAFAAAVRGFEDRHGDIEKANSMKTTIRKEATS